MYLKMLLLFVFLFGPVCGNQYSILMAYPVFDRHSEAVMYAVGKELDLNNHTVFYMPPQPFEDSPNVLNLEVCGEKHERNPRREFINKDYDEKMVKAEAFVRAAIALRDANLDMRKFDAVICPVDQIQSIMPIKSLNPSILVIGVSVDGIKVSPRVTITTSDLMKTSIANHGELFEQEMNAVVNDFNEFKKLPLAHAFLVNSYFLEVENKVNKVKVKTIHDLELPFFAGSELPELADFSITPTHRTIYVDIPEGTDNGYFRDFVKAELIPSLKRIQRHSIVVNYKQSSNQFPEQEKIKQQGEFNQDDGPYSIRFLGSEDHRTDILKSEFTVAYITMCEMQSLHLSIHFSVPMICFAHTPEQIVAARIMKNKQVAKTVEFPSSLSDSDSIDLGSLLDLSIIKRNIQELFEASTLELKKPPLAAAAYFVEECITNSWKLRQLEKTECYDMNLYFMWFIVFTSTMVVLTSGLIHLAYKNNVLASTIVVFLAFHYMMFGAQVDYIRRVLFFFTQKWELCFNVDYN